MNPCYPTFRLSRISWRPVLELRRIKLVVTIEVQELPEANSLSSGTYLVLVKHKPQDGIKGPCRETKIPGPTPSCRVIIGLREKLAHVSADDLLVHDEGRAGLCSCQNVLLGVLSGNVRNRTFFLTILEAAGARVLHPI